MERVRERFRQTASFVRLAASVSERTPITVSGLWGAGRGLLADGLHEFGNVVYVAVDEAARQTVMRDIESLRGRQEVLALLSDAQSQLQLLNSLAVRSRRLIVTDAATLQARAVKPPEAELQIRLTRGAERSRDELVHWLDQVGFERADLVTEPGEFVARGGIVDVFPEQAEYPVRLEFLGDTVESLRRFDPLTQRSVEALDEVGLEARGSAGISDRSIAALLPTDRLVASECEAAVAAAGHVRIVARDGDIDFGLDRAPAYVGNLALLRTELETSRERCYVVCSDAYQQERLARIVGSRPEYVTGRLSQGFAAPTEGFVVLTERELYGGPVMREARRQFKGLPVDDLLALRPGEYVVHVNYGVGVFEGIKRLKVDGFDHDFLNVRYAEGGRVYVPIENLGMLDRYIGAEDRAPGLDRLGSRSWHLARTRTATAVADYAEDLLALHARRSAATGFAFARDTPWQTEMEDSFIHEATVDQLRSIREVKRDMESSRPMDRLVCGDVGYGKTEVALRAAFKAVMDAKQVALLVPTTILAYQHYNTFRARMADYPLRIAMLSRFVPPGERALTSEALAQGRVDIVVGTHMLLSRDVKFRDLGLMIVDEEQKFGVRQKERIKDLKTSVDVLTLSATPIPRTLYMSLVGLRDISTIHTAPAGRREIETAVRPWQDETIRSYILREAARGGQVFFIHNRIDSLPGVFNKLSRLCPDLRIAQAHGRMPERRLARVYLDFAQGEYDVLVSTAIIESGLDLPRVNTLIVNRADWFGLADLHQLRGRVGRTQEQAYALFIIPDRHDISEEARKRLSAVVAYSRLGSGFKLAMRDMEIRGVGNLLGTEQHGHVARVGFNLYAQLLKEAVARLKGEEIVVEPELKLDCEAFLPEAYIGDSYERVAIYKRLLSVEGEAEIDALRVELQDRFGRHQDIVENLFRVALVRVLARKARLLSVSLKGRRIALVAEHREQVLEGDLDRLIAELRRPARG